MSPSLCIDVILKERVLGATEAGNSLIELGSVLPALRIPLENIFVDIAALVTGDAVTHFPNLKSDRKSSV